MYILLFIPPPYNKSTVTHNYDGQKGSLPCVIENDVMTDYLTFVYHCKGMMKLIFYETCNLCKDYNRSWVLSLSSGHSTAGASDYRR